MRLDEPMVENRRVKSLASSNNAKDVNTSNDDWVVQDVRSAYSKFLTTAALRALVDVQDIVDSSVPDSVFSLRRCLPTDQVFHGRGSFSVDFFFMYAQMMKDSCIVIPFDDFCLDLLCFFECRAHSVAP